MRAQFTLRSGQRITLGGFMTVSPARLRALSGDQLARLAVSGDLDLIYAHLHSQRNFTPTAERLLQVVAPAPAGDGALSALEGGDQGAQSDAKRMADSGRSISNDTNN
jgi:hypothetical protein